MKIRVSMKSNSDTLEQAITDVLDAKHHDLTIRERLDAVDHIYDQVSAQWMKHGEFLTVEFNLDTMTATVVPVG